MKITAIETRHYRLPLDPPFRAAWDPAARNEFMATLVKVHTDEGITGVGSGDLMVGFSGNEELFVGRDPFDVQRHWQVMENLNFHYGRCWPLDLALWDLRGKALGKPVFQLLGGSRAHIRAYASTGELVAPQERVERTQALMAQGFSAMKIRFHHQDPARDIHVVEAVRKAVGDSLEIMVDANQGWKMPWDVSPSWDLKTAVQVARQLEELGVYWLEEPLACDDFRSMATLRRMTGLRIAGGEMNRQWHDFRELNRHAALDVYQPDVALCGGITGVKKIAEMVQADGAWFSPHTWTNGIGLLANLHLACAVSQCPFVEFPYDPPAWTCERRDFMLAGAVTVDDRGFFTLPPDPGLGIRLDEAALARYEI